MRFILPSLTDARAQGNCRAEDQERPQFLHNLCHMRVLGVSIDGILIGPPVYDVKCIGIVDLLIDIVIKASVFEPGRLDKLQHELPNPVSIFGLATQLTDDVTFL
jgi:hypothetical protein